MDIWFYMLGGLLQSIPLWIFGVPLVILIAICIRFRRRVVLRNVCLVISLLIALAAIPVSAAKAYFETGGVAALKDRFGDLIDANSVSRYRFVLAGIGDTLEYWQLKNVSPSVCQSLIHKYNLEKMPAVALFRPNSMLGAPEWWPISTENYVVLQGEGDRRYGGSIELWMPKNGSATYLFRFID